MEVVLELEGPIVAMIEYQGRIMVATPNGVWRQNEDGVFIQIIAASSEHGMAIGINNG